MTPEEIGALVSVIDTDGRYWWRDGEGACYATAEYADGTGHEYLMYASPKWVAQWGGDWQAASDALAVIANQS
jgi:hypothetical protein